MYDDVVVAFNRTLALRPPRRPAEVHEVAKACVRHCLPDEPIRRRSGLAFELATAWLSANGDPRDVAAGLALMDD